MAWLALLVAVAAVAGAAGAARETGRHPEHCSYSDDSSVDTDLMCQRHDGAPLVRLNGKRGGNLIIECQEAASYELSCEDIPDFDFGHELPLAKELAVRDCALGALRLACVLARLRIANLTQLELLDAPEPLALTEPLVAGLRHLTTLVLEPYSGEPVSVSRSALAALPALSSLTVRGAGSALAPEALLALEAAPGLRHLELSATLPALPARPFSRLARLERLMLRPTLTNLSDDTLHGLSSLSELELSTNRLQRLEGRMLRGGEEAEGVPLRTLRADNNPLQLLGALAPLPRLQMVQIRNNHVELTVGPRALASLPELAAVQLSGSGIRSLPADAFAESSAITALDLSGNKLRRLPAQLFQDQTRMVTLSLSNNALEVLERNVFWPLKALEELKLDGNRLVELPPMLLDRLGKLLKLHASRNLLREVPSAALVGAEKLQEITLADNQLVFYDPDDDKYFNMGNSNVSPFNALHELQVVDLSGNRVRALFSDVPVLLTQLRLLDLSRNNISEVDGYGTDIAFLSTAVTVDLRHNNITSVFLTPQVFRSPNDSSSSSSSRLLLDDNPLHCDCQLFDLGRRLRGYRPLSAEIVIDVGDAQCATPTELRGRRVRDLQLSEFMCQETCADNCTCIVHRASSTLELDCLAPPVTFPALEHYQLDYLKVKLRSPPKDLAWMPDIVRSLDLSELGMRDIPPGASAFLQDLNLAGNNLTRVPMELLAGNLTLRLSRNKFVCDCWYSVEIASLQESQRLVSDYEAVTCSDGTPVSRVDAARLCDTMIAATVGGVLALLGLVVAVSAVLLYRYSLELRVFLYNRGWCARWVNEEELDKDKIYDAFLSFSHEDEDFVIGNLLPGLEAGPKPFKVCVHVRDWIPGEWIPAQIARSVDQSRRTIVVLSKNFLKSLWGRLEFRTANMSAVSERRSRVIVVLLEDVSGEEEVEAELRAYLATNTYLKWGDPWFWDRLRYALPHRRDEAAVIRAGDKILAKFFGVAAEKGGKGAEGKGAMALDTRLTKDGKIINAAIKAPPPTALTAAPPCPV